MYAAKVPCLTLPGAMHLHSGCADCTRQSACTWMFHDGSMCVHHLHSCKQLQRQLAVFAAAVSAYCFGGANSCAATFNGHSLAQAALLERRRSNAAWLHLTPPTSTLCTCPGSAITSASGGGKRPSAWSKSHSTGCTEARKGHMWLCPSIAWQLLLNASSAVVAVSAGALMSLMALEAQLSVHRTKVE